MNLVALLAALGLLLLYNGLTVPPVTTDRGSCLALTIVRSMPVFLP